MEANNLTILAIDDHQDNLTTLKAVVADAFPEARVLSALNGRKGIELALAEDPDVILLDIVMPGMDGFEVCRRLKNDEVLRHIPVVFLTALKTGRESRIKALETGAEAFLSKPIEEAELTAQIRAMVKIKAAGVAQRQEKERLAALVAERTLKLNQELAERRKAEEALRKSEKKYRELVENANCIIMRRDNVGNVTFFNEFAQNFFGYGEEQILGKNVVGTIVPQFESTTGRDLRLMVEDIAVNPDRYAKNENENMRSNGERIWIAWTNKPVFDEYGRVREILCIGNDITERKQAEEALRESEKRFKHLLESVTDYIFTVQVQDNCRLKERMRKPDEP